MKMHGPLAVLLAAASLGAVATACSRRPANADALEANVDANTPSDAARETVDAATSEAVSDAAQSDAGDDAGAASTDFTSWTWCGWSSSETCLCEGIRACDAVAGGSFSALGSRQARVCAIHGDDCEYVVFVETEGGGTARRCRAPIGAGSCTDGFTDCVTLFTCNLLMGTCPPDVMPGGPVISCR